nr:retrovirus-related Pol polyprotein from transposon TNT 1-94 [Tanacetum cinerariifolium]
DEALDFIIKFLKMIQVRLKVPVRRIQTNNGTEFVNQTLREYYEQVGISHETSVARSPQQNDVVERRNRTLIEAARTMLIYAQALLFLWAEAVATACYTQNRSIIRLCHGKTPYELLHNKLPDLSFLHVFGALCYPTNDSENLRKFQPKADIGIFIGYAPTKKAFRIYNRRTRRIVETIHVDFDEMTAMAFEQSSFGPALNEMTPVTISSGLVLKPSSSTPYVPPSRNDWDLLFQPIENLGKLKSKVDIRIFIGYAHAKKAFRIYNRRTRVIVETIHVDFDELTAMAFEQSSSGPALNEMTPVTISSGLVLKPSSLTPYVPPSRNDWDLLFQPMFGELLNPSPSVDIQTPEVIASIVDVIPLIQAESTGSPSSTTVDQGVPSPSKS